MWVIRNINNISIKRKLLSMYVLSVLIPILVLNTIFYFVISKNVKEKELTVLNQSVGRIADGFMENIEQCMRVYITINSDRMLNSMIDTIYTTPQSYINAYNEYMRDAVERYISVYSQIQHINIFTQNKSMIESGYLRGIDSNILNSKWYKKFQETKSSNLIYAYTESQPEMLIQDKRYLSVISTPSRNTRFYSGNKIVKIDIILDSLGKVIDAEKTEGAIYVVDDNNKIIFSNNPEVNNSYGEFISFNDNFYSSKNIVITKNLEEGGYMKNWKVIGVFPEKSVAVSVKNSKYIVILVAGITLLIATSVIFFISDSIKTRLELVSRHLKKVSKDNLDIIHCDTGEDEIGELIKEYNKSTITIKNLIEEVYEAEISKTKAELRALQTQVNPHFLYNTLNTVRLRSVLKGEMETAEIIKYMAKLFRRLLAWEEDLVTIKEEIELTKDFLEIQKYRYGEKLNYKINLDNDVLCYKIPKMCIQTLVENSSVHGIEEIDGVGLITVEISITEDRLLCVVNDNGIGIEKERLEAIKAKLKQGESIGGSYGTNNIYKRLKLYFGEDVDFQINSELNKGTNVRFSIPIGKLEKY